MTKIIILVTYQRRFWSSCLLDIYARITYCYAVPYKKKKSEKTLEYIPTIGICFSVERIVKFVEETCFTNIFFILKKLIRIFIKKIRIPTVKKYPQMTVVLWFSPLVEYTPESSLVKIWPIKSLLAKKNLKHPALQCILHNLIHPDGNLE